MKDNEILLKKMEAKKLEWESQVKHFQSKLANFDAEKRTEFEKQIQNLKERLKKAEGQLSEFKKVGKEAGHNLGENISKSWNELIVDIDNLTSKLKK